MGNVGTLITTACCLVVALASAVHAEPPDDGQASLRSQVLERVKAARDRLNLTSATADFSVRLSIGDRDGEAGGVHVVASASRRAARMTVIGRDQHPYAISEQGLVVSFALDGGETMALARGGAPVLTLGRTGVDRDGINFGHWPNRLSSVIRLDFEEVIEGAIRDARVVEYSEPDDRLTCLLDDRTIEFDFDWRPDALCAVERFTVVRDGRVAFTVSGIAEGTEKALDASATAAIWRALGLPAIDLEPDRMTPAMFLPPPDFERSATGVERVRRLEALARQWPDKSPASLSDEGEEGVRESRQAARSLFKKNANTFRRLDEARRLLQSDDAETRWWVMAALGTAPPADFDQATTLSLIASGVEDASPVVREIALNVLARQLHAGTVEPSEALASLAKAAIARADGPMEVRPATYVLERASGGAFQAGQYPRDPKGWPRYDEDAIAWWLLHSEEIKERAAAWSPAGTAHGSE